MAFNFFRKQQPVSQPAGEPASSAGAPAPAAQPFQVINRHHYRLLTGGSFGRLFRHGARLRSHEAADLLALHGSKGKLDWNGLEAAIEAGEPLQENWRPDCLLGAAMLNCMFEGTAKSREVTLDLLRAALALSRFPETAAHSQLWLQLHQLALLAHDRELLAALTAIESPGDDVVWATDTDLLLPDDVSRADAAEVDAWLASFNAPLTEAGLEAWRLDRSAESAEQTVFERLHAPAAPDCAIRLEDQPLVTVVVPTYNPGRSFLNTIESLVAQSWRNLEVLIVDDASPHGEELIAAAAATDPRVGVIRLPENGGAYVARNTGIAAAAGEFCTVLDADDQAHPRRLEIQMRPLLESDALVASMSRSVRLVDNGRLTMFGFLPTRNNLSSLLFRRRRVVDAIGRYDEVRKAADTEYFERMIHRFGRDAIVQQPEILGLVQLTEGSLSRGDFHPGWWHGGRLAYRNQFRGWHEYRLPEGEDFADLTTAPRNFVAPTSLRRQPDPEHLQFAFLADWSVDSTRLDGTVGLIGRIATQHAETPVGLLHGIRLGSTRAGRHAPPRELWEFIERGDAAWLSWAQHTRIDTLFVPDPIYLAMLPNISEIGLSVGRVVVSVEHAQATRKDGIGVLDPKWIDEHCKRAFGTEATWLPATADLRALLTRRGARQLPVGRLRLAAAAPASATAEAEAEAEAVSTASGAATGIAVGVMSALRREELRLAIMREFADVDAAVRLIVHDPEHRFDDEQRERMPSGIALSDAHALADPGEAAGPDVLVIDPLDARPLTFMPAGQLWEALARGIVVVMPQSYAHEYEGGITTFVPGELQPLLARLAHDPEFRGARSRAAREFAAAQASAESLAAVLRTVAA